MADYLKLFTDKRLSMNEPHHVEFIKGRLAAMKSEGQQQYKEYSEHYGVDMEVTLKTPEAVEVLAETPAAPKKRGRPAKA